MGNNIITFSGKKPEIAEGVWVDSSAVVIGDVTIGRDSSIWPIAVIRGDANRITIGDRTNVQDGTIIHVARPTESNLLGHPTVIGNDVTIGHGVVLHGCIVEDAVLVGTRATVLDGARIERHSMLGAGSLLTPNKVIREGEVWMGSPARFIRRMSDQEIEQLYVSAQQYGMLKDIYLKQ